MSNIGKMNIFLGHQKLFRILEAPIIFSSIVYGSVSIFTYVKVFDYFLYVCGFSAFLIDAYI